MLKRIGLFSAALFATLAFMHPQTASAQNRDDIGRYGYNVHQQNGYVQGNSQWNGNHNAPQYGVGYNRQPNGYSFNDGRSNGYGYNARWPIVRPSQSGDHERTSLRHWRSDDDDNRRER